MEEKAKQFINSVGNFFNKRSESIPTCNSEIVAGVEAEVAEANKGTDVNYQNDCCIRLSWALVHSKRSQDVQRGIAMLEAALTGESLNLVEKRERLYLLTVGYFKSGDYGKSRQLVEQCLEMAPDWRQAQNLQKAIEDRITTDGVIGIGIAVTAVGLVVGGVAAALARKN